MQKRVPDRAASLFARVQRWLHLDAVDDRMPQCPCDVARAASAAAGSATTQAGTPPREPALRLESDRDRIERAATYAVGGYFHASFLADTFVYLPEVWLGGDGEY